MKKDFKAPYEDDQDFEDHFNLDKNPRRKILLNRDED